jgi:amidase
MNRRQLFPFVLFTSYFLLLSSLPMSAKTKPFVIVESTIRDMQDAMRHKRITSRELVRQYLARIEQYNGRLNAVITVNPRALEEAEARDRERARGRVRGPLHGIPIAIKDNIQTTDMPTTGGALAFKGFVPPYEATIVTRLREAGAVIIAKTTLTELANWVASGMPANYNAIAGHAMNPYDPRLDPRSGTNDGRSVLSTGGSSSGVGTAANFWMANVGTETSGSILSPSNQNMLAAIKPTVGRISRYGVIPITADQDTAGPMARSVADVATLLGVLEGRVDPNDPATSACARVRRNDYTRFLKRKALKGARIGIPRAYFYEPATTAGNGQSRGGLSDEQKKLMDEAIAILKKQGAIIIDPADLPSVLSSDPASNILQWNACSGLGNGKGSDSGCTVVLKYGMKRDFDAWAARLGPTAPVKSLTELRRWNLAHQSDGAIKYGQAQLDISDDMDVVGDLAHYQADRAKDIRLSATEGIDAVMKRERLDALLFPSVTGYNIAARPGYPTVMVPFGFVTPSPSPAYPEGFDPKPAPFSVSFTGMACSEPRLIALAYAFEQVTKRRVPPPLFP